MIRLLLISVISVVMFFIVAAWLGQTFSPNIAAALAALLTVIIFPIVVLKYVWKDRDSMRGVKVQPKVDPDDPEMEAVFIRILTGTQKQFIGEKPLFEPHAPAKDLAEIENKMGVTLPGPLKKWLSVAGYGDINGVLSIRRDWFHVIDRGELKGHIIFAMDELGDFYSLSPRDGSIHFINRSVPEYAFVANDFSGFLAEFERMDFKLDELIDKLHEKPYNWDT